jgi:hypothetical protein
MDEIKIKEIHVDGIINDRLLSLANSQSELWRSVADRAELCIYFDMDVVVSSLEIQFWTTCYPSRIKLSAETMNVHSQLTFNLVSTISLNVPDGCVNRMVKFDGGFPVTRKLKLELEGGYLDPLFRRFKLGIMMLRVTGVPFVSAHDAHETSGSSREFPNNPNPTRKMSDKEVAPLFAFPDAQLVMSAVKNLESDAWKILSAGSMHRKKLKERRSREILNAKYILQPYYPASGETIPTRHEILRIT